MTTHSEKLEHKEVWASVAVCGDYDVSTRGRVRRCDTGRILNPKPRRNGYISVSLSIPGIGKKRFYVHRLVAQAFIGELEPEMEVNHLDFVRDNNSVGNLEIVTRLANHQYSTAAGHYAHAGDKTPKGDASHLSKVTSAQVAIIRELLKAGRTKSSLARDFRLCKQQIANIVNGISWRANAA